ncbi:MAG: argininosuccinate lyase [Elusimicrobia bacterium]|nr:argininosuccinate lyase [Elusimicrobiota bacterium]
MKKLWQTDGGLNKAVEAYTVCGDPALDARLLPYEVYGTLAHAAGLVKAGVLTKREHESLRRALAKIAGQNGGFKITMAQEDIHTAMEQALGAIGLKVHAGRSRNDQVQVDLRLYLKDALGGLCELACAAAGAWEDFGRRHDKVLMPGYSHLQRAMPTTVGHWAASHAEALLEGVRVLDFARGEADACPLGSAAGYGVLLPLDRPYVARLLGFSRVQRNTLRVQSSRPRLEAAAVSALALAARDIGTLAWDLSLYISAEFGFFALDAAFTTGSSLMPQKRNPDVVELTRARAALFPGWVSQVLSLAQLPSGYHRDYQLTKGPLLAAIDAAGQMLDMAARLPGALRVDAARCQRAVTQDMLATHEAMRLVKDGVPFRTAYRRIAGGARKAEAASAPARGVELPGYAGAPGNPDWRAIAAERKAWQERLVKRRARLHAAWRRLADRPLA